MLKGKQKKLDKNKDGKISGEDFKMMKANTGKMASFSKFVESQSGAATTKKELKELKTKYIKKMSGAAISESEARKLNKTIPKLYQGGESKAKDGKIIKAGLGTMAQDLVRKVFGKNKAVAKTGSNMGAMSFKGKKLPIETLVQKATEQNKAKSGKMMKAKYGKMTKANMGMEAESTQGYGAARTQGEGLQDEDLIPGKSMDYYKDIV